jgi:drug/metabolite transporter (DMT)-like permease
VTAILLALLTAVVWGLANYLGPLLSRTHPLGPILLAGQVVGVVGGLALYAVSGTGFPETRALWLGIASGIFNGLALATFYKAAATGPISVVAPIGATGALVPVLVAIGLGERPSALQALGIPLAVLGVALAAARSAPAAGAPQQVRAGIALSLTAALTYGTFLTLFAAAAEDGPATAVLTSRTALLVATAAALLLLRQQMTVPLRALPRVALPGLLLFVGTASYGIATSTGLVSVVTVLATLNPVITVGLAVLVLGERLAPRQQLGVAAALVGVILLAAG